MANNKKKLLFVDDRSKRIHDALKRWGGESGEYDVTIAPNVKEALRLLSHEVWDVVSLDYDLNGDDFLPPDHPDCGLRIVEAMADWPTWGWGKKPTVWVHSSNIFGAERMMNALKQEGFSPQKKMMGW